MALTAEGGYTRRGGAGGFINMTSAYARACAGKPFASNLVFTQGYQQYSGYPSQQWTIIARLDIIIGHCERNVVKRRNLTR